MSDTLPYWQADVKIAGQNASVVYDDGDWSATGDGSAALLTQLQSGIAERIDAAPFNPFVTGRLGDIFAESLRAISPVYGIDTNFGDDAETDDDAVI